MSIDIYDSTVDDGNAEFIDQKLSMFDHVESLQDTLNEYHQSFIKDTVISLAYIH